MSLDFYLGAWVDLGRDEPHWFCVFSENMTHNVTPMWRAAGCYEALYESDGKRARDVLPAIEAAYAAMAKHSAKYRAMDAPNGWGTYDTALPFLLRVRNACERWPRATIRVSR